MFCQELFEVALFKTREMIRGPGKVVQIDKSRIGKRKYRGLVAEGQWVFGGIEEDPRKCFIATVENRTEETLLVPIKEWIALGTIIVSDCWKAYSNLEKHDIIHKTVNLSKEFDNEEGYHTIKIDGHWQQLRVKLPTHG